MGGARWVTLSLVVVACSTDAGPVQGIDASAPDGSTADGSAPDGSTADGSAPDAEAAVCGIPQPSRLTAPCPAGMVGFVDGWCDPPGSPDERCRTCGAEECFEECGSDADCTDPCRPRCRQVDQCDWTDSCGPSGLWFCLYDGERTGC